MGLDKHLSAAAWSLHRCARSDPPFLFLMQTPVPPESLGGGSFDLGIMNETRPRRLRN